jgi:hypothetical protein
MSSAATSRLIYVDTSMWNRLHDQRVPAREVSARLAELNSAVVVGEHAVHELAKTFMSARPGAGDRAAGLCSYLRDFVDSGVSVIKQNWALLIEEAMNIVGDGGVPEILVAETHRQFLRARLDELASQTVSPEIRKELEFRTLASRDHTASMKEVLARETRLATHLRTIEAEQLKDWIDAETTRSLGVQALQINLREQFPQNDPTDLSEISRRLLDRPRYRVSRALARTTLYSLWRCANFGTVPKDFNDDTVHLTNASYCEFFVTADPQHAQQRAEVFDMCRLILCARPTDLLQWLVSELTQYDARVER